MQEVETKRSGILYDFIVRAMAMPNWLFITYLPKCSPWLSSRGIMCALRAVGGPLFNHPLTLTLTFAFTLLSKPGPEKPTRALRLVFHMMFSPPAQALSSLVRHADHRGKSHKATNRKNRRRSNVVMAVPKQTGEE